MRWLQQLSREEGEDLACGGCSSCQERRGRTSHVVAAAAVKRGGGGPRMQRLQQLSRENRRTDEGAPLAASNILLIYRTAIIAAAEAGLPIYEYAPRKIKAVVTGRGAAGKTQVSQMVKMLLGLKELPPEDAADALAIAICHAHSTQGIMVQPPKQI